MDPAGALRHVVDLVLPPRCPACGRVGVAPCASCWAGLAPAPVVPVRAPLASAAAVAHYSGPARRLVTATKYGRHRDGWSALGRSIAALSPPSVEVVCWVPATPARRRRRGFDQAELLARSAAAALGLPAVGVLVRLDHRAQAGRNRHDRLAGPELAPIRARRTTDAVVGRVVLLVDDVVTTGSSLASAAAVLQGLGATAVHARAFAAAGWPSGSLHAGTLVRTGDEPQGLGAPAPQAAAATLYHRVHAHPGGPSV